MSELKAQLRAERIKNEELSQKVERLENAQAVMKMHEKSGAPQISPSAHEAEPMPALTVVKLKPKAEPAPKIDTSVKVVEPPPEVVNELDTATAVYTDDTVGPDGTQLASAKAAAKDQPVDPAILEAEYQAGVEALKTGNVEGGVQKLQQFAAEHPRHARADNALYFAGLGLMGLNDFDGAAQSFTQVVDGYPAGDATVDAMLKLAECRLHLHQSEDARALYSKVMQTYPGTAAATQAQQRLAALH